MARFFSATTCLLTSVLVSSACGGSAQQPKPPDRRQIFVDVTTGLDTNAGTAGAPFKTITRGLAQAGSEATPSDVRIAAGTYDGSTGETFPLLVPTLTAVIGSGMVDVDGAGTYTITGGEMVDAGDASVDTTFAFAPGVEASLAGITADGTAPTAVVVDGATVTLDRDTFQFDVGDSAYAVWVVNGSQATVTGSTLSGWVAIDTADAATKLVVRGSHLDGSFTVCTADFTASVSQLDLGTAANPGNNTLLRSGSGDAAVNDWGADGDLGVSAVGNTWTPGEQGADASGHYTPGTHVGGAASGVNFEIQPTAGIDL
jgi:hypothetical protein